MVTLLNNSTFKAYSRYIENVIYLRTSGIFFKKQNELNLTTRPVVAVWHLFYCIFLVMVCLQRYPMMIPNARVLWILWLCRLNAIIRPSCDRCHRSNPCFFHYYFHTRSVCMIMAIFECLYKMCMYRDIRTVHQSPAK